MDSQTVPALLGILGAGLAGVLVLWLASACRRGTLKRNPLLGVRTPSTLRSDEAWIAAHRAGAPQLAIGGWGLMAAGAVAAVFLIVGRPVPGIPLTVVLGFVWMLGWLIASGFVAGRVARRI
ncbi:SdpI family protein [Microbacterium sp.]|uniref:SdpI family protein n=1 Tax=Microbacterium sp. TaxID=51671 RepID=UPI00333F12D2